MSRFPKLTNGASCPIRDIPVLDYDSFCGFLEERIGAGARICSLFGVPEKQGLRLYAVSADDSDSTLTVAAMNVEAAYPSLTLHFPCLHLFEREIHEQFSILPEGHPWLKPVRFERGDGPPVGIMDFFTVEGEDVHEVAVGPIHAGIIECGHFRFQCMGETVIHLEISLGYHHRGIERACNAGPSRAALPLMETLAGDSSIAHAWAYCSLLEALSGLPACPRGQTLRAVALELERLANHTGDLGALAGDVGYLPTASFCGRLRGDFLNMTAMLCGNRFGRGLIAPGGVLFDADEELCCKLEERLQATVRDVHGAVDLMWESPSVTTRMMDIGVVSEQAADALGFVGITARASGVGRDARITHPLPGRDGRDIALRVMESGDVYARARLRQEDLRESTAFISKLLRRLPEGDIRNAPGPSFSSAPSALPLAPDSFAVVLVEGWRGEICHAALTDAAGSLCRCKVVDPSFHNWPALALALRNGQISDFPLCNKSFNLSYCGHDL